MHRLTDIGWEDYSALPLEEKKSYLERHDGGGMPYHTLFAQHELFRRLRGTRRARGRQLDVQLLRFHQKYPPLSMISLMVSPWRTQLKMSISLRSMPSARSSTS